MDLVTAMTPCDIVHSPERQEGALFLAARMVLHLTPYDEQIRYNAYKFVSVIFSNSNFFRISYMLNTDQVQSST